MAAIRAKRRQTMSDMGLNASLYQQLRSYADRLDRAIAVLRGDDRTSARTASTEIAGILREIRRDNQQNPHARIIWMILKQELPRTTAEGVGMIAGLVTSLETGQLGQADIAKLERVATIIDRECTDTVSRMRGRL
jgi:hypothetical protein